MPQGTPAYPGADEVPLPLPFPVESATPAGGLVPSPTPSVPFDPAPASPTPTPAAVTFQYEPWPGIVHVLHAERQVGAYTLRLWRDANSAGLNMLGLAEIAAPGQASIFVEGALAWLDLPALDVTGEGEPDVAILANPVGSNHCCHSTHVYNLGATADRVLLRADQAYSFGGTGAFEDLDGDGRYEFLTRAPIRAPCSQPTVRLVFEYQPGRGYVAAGARFAEFYTSEAIARTPASGSDPLDVCGLWEMTILHHLAGQPDTARAEFQRLTAEAAEAQALWAQILADMRQNPDLSEAVGALP